MDETQPALVHATFAQVAPISEQSAAMGYDKRFALDPDLRPLFRIDMKRQGRMLMAVIATAVGNLHRLGQILPTVRELGRRRAGYGVKNERHDAVGAALLSTLEAALVGEFPPAVKGAWVACYCALVGEMKAASASVGRRPGAVEATAIAAE